VGASGAAWCDIVNSVQAGTPWGCCADLYDLEWDAWTSRDLPFYLEEVRHHAPVLELACGTGRLAIPIARAGVPVVGLDASAEMLDVARQKGADLSNLELVLGRIETFDLARQFGAILLALSSFYCLGTAEAQGRALRNARRHVRAGGRLLMDMFVPSEANIGKARTNDSDRGPGRLVGTLAEPGTGRVHEIRETVHHVPDEQVFEVNRMIQTFDASGRPTGEVRHIRTADRYVHRAEMEDLLRVSGFEILGLYGGFAREPFTASSTRMVWVATPDASAP
jgi:SAM-dependent methyltransferase